MSTESSPLPWNDLQHVEGGIPWPALRAFAEAVPNDREVTQKLFEVYDRAYATVSEQIGYADLYVPAIFALAAPKLNDEQRRDIGTFLLARLVQAGRDDADLNLETLSAAIGTLGPAVLPLVLDAIENEPDTRGAWVFLWGLTILAAETDDPALRNPVLRSCVELLEQADRGETNPIDAEQAAWTVALLKRTEYTDLLERLRRKPRNFLLLDEYGHALKLLQGRLDYTPPPESWEKPVEEWLEPRCKTARNWFAEREDSVDDEYGEYDECEPGEIEGDADEDRSWLLTDKFMTSPPARSLPAELQEDASFIVSRLAYYSRAIVGADPTEWDEPALRELLLDVSPRKITGDAELFAKIGPVMEAFLAWLGLEGLLDGADALAATVRGWSDQIVTAGMDPQNWGPAKRFVMEAEQAGVDVTDTGALDAYLAEKRRELLGRVPFAEESEPTDYEPPIPIVEHAPKIGRNDPCPCGSGRKYKKCCGNPTKNQADK